MEESRPEIASSQILTNTYFWNDQLHDPGFIAASVSNFQHAPLSDSWEKVILMGMKVEVENTDIASTPDDNVTVYWIATVVQIQGYIAKLRYEGFDLDFSKDFFRNLCSEKVHTVGWCAKNGKLLVPPKSIRMKYEWNALLLKRITGAKTLPENFTRKLGQNLRSLFKKGMTLELIDKARISQVRVASIIDIKGKRLNLKYQDSDEEFWCHEESPLVNQVGWARMVGHEIVASKKYLDRCDLQTYLDTDCKADMFPKRRVPSSNQSFLAGMKLEAVDPLNLGSICVATVMKVLRYGYIMVRIECYEDGDWFCYHSTSPLIFPTGFCNRHDIPLKVPVNYEGEFVWKNYKEKTNTVSAPGWLFRDENECDNEFSIETKIEVTDLINPKFVCGGTIRRVVGRLIRVNFNGWEEFYDQWMDCRCVDIYPLGWAELVGHNLQPPGPLPKEKKSGGRIGLARKRKASISVPDGACVEEQMFCSPMPKTAAPAAVE